MIISRIFAITAASETVRLEAQGKLVQYRRMIHTAVALAVSLPIAIVLLLLVSLLTK